MKLLRKAIGFAIISLCGSVLFSAIITARDPSRFWFALMITTAWIWALGLGDIAADLLAYREEKRQAVQARAKTLRHDEITEPGYYMVKYHNSTMIVEEITQGDIEDGDIDPGSQYIGPLRWPEVQG